VRFSLLKNDGDSVEAPGERVDIKYIFGSSSSLILTTPKFYQEIWLCNSKDVSGSETVYNTGQDETKHKEVCSSSSEISTRVTRRRLHINDCCQTCATYITSCFTHPTTKPLRVSGAFWRLTRRHRNSVLGRSLFVQTQYTIRSSTQVTQCSAISLPSCSTLLKSRHRTSRSEDRQAAAATRGRHSQCRASCYRAGYQSVSHYPCIACAYPPA
jgi:hypothetical protein